MVGHFILSNFKKNDEKLEKIELDKSVSDTSIDNVDDSLNKLAATIEDSFPSEDEKAQAVDYFSEKIQGLDGIDSVELSNDEISKELKNNE